MMKQVYRYTATFEDGFVWHYLSTKDGHYGTARIYGEKHGHGRVARVARVD